MYLKYTYTSAYINAGFGDVCLRKRRRAEYLIKRQERVKAFRFYTFN